MGSFNVSRFALEHYVLILDAFTTRFAIARAPRDDLEYRTRSGRRPKEIKADMSPWTQRCLYLLDCSSHDVECLKMSVWSGLKMSVWSRLKMSVWSRTLRTPDHIAEYDDSRADSWQTERSESRNDRNRLAWDSKSSRTHLLWQDDPEQYCPICW